MNKTVKNYFICALTIALFVILSACSKEDIYTGAASANYKVKITLTGDSNEFYQSLEVQGTDFTGDYSGSGSSSPDEIWEAEDPENEHGFGNTHLEGYYNPNLGNDEAFLLTGSSKHTFYISYNNTPKRNSGSHSMTISIVVYKADDDSSLFPTYEELENITKTFTASNKNTELKWFYGY